MFSYIFNFLIKIICLCIGFFTYINKKKAEKLQKFLRDFKIPLKKKKKKNNAMVVNDLKTFLKM